MSFPLAFGAFAAAAATAIWMQRKNQEVARVTSKIDGRSYLVLRFPDKQEAADQLARINKARPPPAVKPGRAAPMLSRYSGCVTATTLSSELRSMMVL